MFSLTKMIANVRRVVVPDNKLSLAIDRRGQNVRLASFDWCRIDIKSALQI